VNDEADLAADLDDLEELCFSLNITSEERHVLGEADRRPLTSGTSASASTTAPGGSSKDFEVASLDLDEPAHEATNESDNPFDSLRGGQRASYELQQCGALPFGCRIEATPGASTQFFFSVDAAEGPYTPASLTFWVKFFDEFPALDGVSVRSTKRIFHPNIDQDTGHLKLPQDAGANLHVKDLLAAIRGSVLRPTDSPAANADAAMLLQTDPEEFRRVVRSTLGGGEYRGTSFDKVLDFGKKRGDGGYGPSAAQRRSMSDEMKVALMKLDVLQTQCKALADTMIQGNNEECRSLEQELKVVTTSRDRAAVKLACATEELEEEMKLAALQDKAS
jgi:ubiquitin-conjugating enzyme E2 M